MRFSHRTMKRALLALSLLALSGLGIYQLKSMRLAAKSKVSAGTLARTSPQKLSAPDQRARVFSVDGTAQNTYFALPQVQLANLTAARRINQLLVGYFSSVNGDTLAGTARQAVRAAETMFQENDQQGFRGSEFEVLYNAHGVLCLALNISELGAHELNTSSHITFDLRTGRPMALADLIADTTALLGNWRQQVNESTTESVEQAKEYFAQDSANLAYLKELINWDDRTHAVMLYPEPDFALTADGISLFCHYDLPAVWSELSPQEEYAYAWEELRPWWKAQGPWQLLLGGTHHR